MKHTIPPFEAMPPEIRAAVSNGLGPEWLPAPARKALTALSERFFSEADWQHHDWGYHWGCPSRAECDRRFLAAMLRDASRAGPVWRMAACTMLAWLFWLAVRLGGWASYGKGEIQWIDACGVAWSSVPRSTAGGGRPM